MVRQAIARKAAVWRLRISIVMASEIAIGLTMPIAKVAAIAMAYVCVGGCDQIGGCLVPAAGTYLAYNSGPNRPAVL